MRSVSARGRQFSHGFKPSGATPKSLGLTANPGPIIQSPFQNLLGLIIVNSIFKLSFSSFAASQRHARRGVVALSLLALSAAQAQIPPPPPPPASSAGNGQGGGDSGTMGNSGEKPSAAAVACKPFAALTRLQVRRQGGLSSQQGVAAQWALMQASLRQQTNVCMGFAPGVPQSAVASTGAGKR
jgi:hypothetical protein